MNDLPISHPYELGRLGLAGDKVAIAPSQDERARIAHWAGVEAVEAFEARIELRKITRAHYVFDAVLDADIVQNCVVTLDPLRSHIARAFTRELFLTQTRSLDTDVAPLDEEEGREEIASLRYDLAAPVLEELVLAIDPYPRAPDVAFEPPVEEADKPEHPFAALKKLKP